MLGIASAVTAKQSALPFFALHLQGLNSLPSSTVRNCFEALLRPVRDVKIVLLFHNQAVPPAQQRHSPHHHGISSGDAQGRSVPPRRALDIALPDDQIRRSLDASCDKCNVVVGCEQVSVECPYPRLVNPHQSKHLNEKLASRSLREQINWEKNRRERKNENSQWAVNLASSAYSARMLSRSRLLYVNSRIAMTL